MNSKGNLGNFSRAMLVAVCINSLTFSSATSQDYKPGDPVTFGAAHKSPFDNSRPAGTPGSYRYIAPTATGAAGASIPVNMSAPQPPVANPALNGMPDNFLNNRSIEWKPGDPVTLGGAHRPYSQTDNRSQNTNNAPVAPVVSPPTSALLSTPPTATSAAPALQDLMPNPAAPANGFGGPPVSPTLPVAATAPSAASAPSGFSMDTPTAKSVPDTATTKAKNKTREKPKVKQHQKEMDEPTQQNVPPAANDGNFFTHAFRWMGGLFGSNKEQKN